MPKQRTHFNVSEKSKVNFCIRIDGTFVLEKLLQNVSFVCINIPHPQYPRSLQRNGRMVKYNDQFPDAYLDKSIPKTSSPQYRIGDDFYSFWIIKFLFGFFYLKKKKIYFRFYIEKNSRSISFIIFHFS